MDNYDLFELVHNPDLGIEMCTTDAATLQQILRPEGLCADYASQYNDSTVVGRNNPRVCRQAIRTEIRCHMVGHQGTMFARVGTSWRNCRGE
jgi:hypothetical protein